MINYCDNENSLVNTLSHIESFDVFINNRKIKYQQSDVEFVDIYDKISKLFQYSYLMPALGVALNEEVLKEIETDFWLQINFNKEIVNSNGNTNAST